ncbi:ABC transporter permease [Rhizobium cremeum]|uniref:ABC transporter permease n=1 Tax=Rhizobium cremeum TaxID=2813827 RepID=UPI000DDB5791|nr:ABC transporter permease [Rhizobium cremeum]MCJ7995478.1 ABC transporter permease [Rhizobium cremeum]MCJ8000976.1 ABC transporter permease [Rhizobium cremeum]
MARTLFRNLAVPVVLLVLWQLLSQSGFIKPVILPSPLAIIERLWIYLLPAQNLAESAGFADWIWSSELLSDLVASMRRVLLGFAVGAGLALPLGLLMGTDRRFEAYLNPVVQFLRPIPPIAYIPLAILWFGLGDPPAIFLISIGAFFPVLINTISGVRNVDSIYIRAATNLGASRMTMFRRVILPAATPYVLTGMRIGIGTAFIVVIVAEMIAVNSGLGYRILEAREYMWSDKVIAGMIAIGLLGLAIDVGVNRVNNHLLRWHRGIES